MKLMLYYLNILNFKGSNLHNLLKYEQVSRLLKFLFSLRKALKNKLQLQHKNAKDEN